MSDILTGKQDKHKKKMNIDLFLSFWHAQSLYKHQRCSDWLIALQHFHFHNDFTSGHDGSQPYVQILHRLGDVEFVHSGDDDGGGGEEEEQEEEDAVDDEAAKPPGDSSQRQMLPASQTEFTSACSVQQNITQQKEWNLLAW